MTISLTEVRNAALSLPEKERAVLVEDILLSLPSHRAFELDPAWDEIIEARIGEIDRGEVELIPLEVVQAEMKARIKH